MDASYINGLTALAGGGQTGATLLSKTFNRITTVASSGDSVVLPAAAPGLTITVKNAAATNSTNVYPAVGDAINALSANAAFALAAGKSAQFTSYVAGTWDTILSA
jgi:hypothetical protein